MRNLRTASGRAELDAAVAAALTVDPQDIHDLLAKVDATPAQTRASLHRLARTGRVARSGNTRATRYTAPSREAA